MKRHLTVAALCAAAFVAGTFVPVAQMQSAIPGTGEFIVVNYMRVPPSKAAEYAALERDIYKPAHQARVQAGKMKSWALLQTRFGGTDDGYSFATVNTFSRFDDMNGALQEFLAKAHPGKDLTEVQRRMQETREIARTDVWRVIDQTK